MNNEHIDILMATYNGERFLQEQIHSILNQSYSHFRLLICDDQSTDSTPEILAKFEKTYPKHIKIIPGHRKYGSSQCFSFLLEHIESNYIMFADQDDIWLHNKIENAMNSMKLLEQQFGNDIPLLVHSDLKVVNANLDELSSSFWNYCKIFPKKGASLNRLLVQNVVTGCSILMNRALVNKALPIPEESIQHDWWLALVAAAFGHIKEIDQPSILYRQHSANAIGALKYNPFTYFWRRMKTPLEVDRAYRLRNINQAKAILLRYSTTLPAEHETAIKDYCSFLHLKFFKSITLILKHGFYKHGISRNIIGLCPKGIFKRLKNKSKSLFQKNYS